MPMTRSQFLMQTAVALAAPKVAMARSRVPHCGVGYEVADGAFRATSWDVARMRGDMAAIAGRLHATSVSVFGDGVDRLLATAEEAAGHGLHVWLQPRLGDVPRKEILDQIGEAGRRADALRRQGASIDLSVGAEFVLFVPGIVGGADAVERVHNLLNGNYDGAKLQRRLTAFIADAARVGRASFGGRLSYAAAKDDVVDWSLFDVVSVDYYGNSTAALHRLRRFGKPVAIAEFGACTYRGAVRRGGLAWDVLDATGNRLRKPLHRDEAEQARYLVERVRLFDRLGFDTASVYQFVTPDAPHRRGGGRDDLDLASYGIVKPIWESFDHPGDWRWKPKAAFHALAREWAA